MKKNKDYIVKQLERGRKRTYLFEFKSLPLSDEEIENLCLAHDYLFQPTFKVDKDNNTILYSGWID